MPSQGGDECTRCLTKFSRPTLPHIVVVGGQFVGVVNGRGQPTYPIAVQAQEMERWERGNVLPTHAVYLVAR